MQEDRTPSCARLEQDSKGAKGHHQFSYLFYALNVVRCRKVELTTLNITLLGRQPKYCEITFSFDLVVFSILVYFSF